MSETVIPNPKFILIDLESQSGKLLCCFFWPCQNPPQWFLQKNFDAESTGVVANLNYLYHISLFDNLEGI